MEIFKDKIAVITGAASGIGKAIAQHCIKENMKTVLADIDEHELNKLEKDLINEGATVLSVVTDVSREGDIKNLKHKTMDAFGEIHLLFNNAGVVVSGRKCLWEYSIADWTWTLNVNMWGVIHGIKVFVPLMLAQNTPCHIVNTASMGGLLNPPEHGAYTVSKHAVVAISEVLYHELKKCNAQIDVSVLCPGFVKTRIYNAEKNRPKELNDGIASNNAKEWVEDERLKKHFLSAISPETVSQQVFKAIRERKFYILTHPEYKTIVKKRMEDILRDINPSKESYSLEEKPR